MGEVHLIGLLVEGKERLLHTQLLRYQKDGSAQFLLPPFGFHKLGIASLKEGFEFDYLNNWNRELLCYGKSAGYIEPGTGIEEKIQEYIAKKILENRRYEIVGWLIPEDGSQIRPHSATVEAVTNDRALEMAYGYTIPHYSWDLRRINRLEIDGRAVIHKNEGAAFLSDDAVFGNYYEAHGIISDADGHEHMEDRTYSFQLRAITDGEAIHKAKDSHFQWYHWHLTGLDRLEWDKKRRIFTA